MISLEANAAREQLKHLAKGKQDELVSCPRCAQSLKGKNLVLHYDREHAWESGEILEHAQGVDERAATQCLILSFFITPVGLFVDTQLELNDVLFWACSAIATLGFAIVLLNAVYRISRSALTIREDHLVLARRCWLNSTLRLPVRSVQIGAMKDSSGGSDGDRDTRDVPYRSWTDGTYLKIRTRSGTLLAHCPHVGLGSQQLRWDRGSYSLGKPGHRRWSHIRLEREECDALLRWLRDTGALRTAPRPDSARPSRDVRPGAQPAFGQTHSE